MQLDCVMADLLRLARRSPAKFPKAVSPHCIFCGVAGRLWHDFHSQPGCGCEWARRVRGDCKPAEKLEFQMYPRRETGRLVITKCSPELWSPLIETGIAIGIYKAAMGRELPEDSRQAMRDAVAAFKARKTEQRPVETEQDVAQFASELSETEPSVSNEINELDEIEQTEQEKIPGRRLSDGDEHPTGAREHKRMRIMAQILLGKTDLAISRDLGVSRNTVATVRRTIKR